MQVENGLQTAQNIEMSFKIWIALLGNEIKVGFGRVGHNIKMTSQVKNVQKITTVQIMSNSQEFFVEGVYCPGEIGNIRTLKTTI